MKGGKENIKTKKISYLVVFVGLLVIFVLWYTGLVGLWTNGIAFLANNTQKYTHEDGHLLKGSYSLEVDLTNLESNIGQEIYNDGEHRIYVSWIQRTPDGSCDVGFRSSGQYSLRGATLVSGIFHEAINDHSFTMSTTAKLTVKDHGEIYEAQATGRCGLNYKDGDCFSFAFSQGEKSKVEGAEDAGIVILTISDLYKNIWRKI